MQNGENGDQQAAAAHRLVAAFQELDQDRQRDLLEYAREQRAEQLAGRQGEA